jgi:hypothetical protein
VRYIPAVLICWVGAVFLYCCGNIFGFLAVEIASFIYVGGSLLVFIESRFPQYAKSDYVCWNDLFRFVMDRRSAYDKKVRLMAINKVLMIHGVYTDSTFQKYIRSFEQPQPPKNIDIDPDFYGERSTVERESAILAKFEQNEDLKLLLFNTKNAKLVHYIHGTPGEPDMILMNIRHKLLNLDSYTSR